jgi:hypothetical protein
MMSHYGDQFRCQLPGIWTNSTYKLPVCNHYDLSDDDAEQVLGLLDLIRNADYWKTPALTQPAIGIYKDQSDCVRRCRQYQYTLALEETSRYDEKMDKNDLYLYFASNTVEVWSEYRLNSFMGLVAAFGGSVGLTLGMSMLSLILVLFEYLGTSLKYFSARGGKGKKKMYK